ncbi:MAG: right-handed parallel beta-helix repeat-containing protein [Planctomycetota bacterium]|jgi:hypothetical protein
MLSIKLRSFLTTASILLVIFLSSAVGKVIYVDDDAAGANDGTSWANAYLGLQDALADANDGPKPAEIHVAQGIYKPDRGAYQTSGRKDAAFLLINNVTLKGGFAGLGQADPNVRDVDLYETILSGDLNGDDVEVTYPRDLLAEPTRGENSYHVVTGSGIDGTAMLDGLTITGGNADGPTSYNCGAGMYNHSASPRLSNCTFRGNSADGCGGAMYNVGSHPTLENCKFSGNVVTGNAADIRWPGSCGGAIYNVHSNPTLTTCTFTGNLANSVVRWSMGGKQWQITKESCGGGIYNSGSSPILTGCIFTGNSASYGGGLCGVSSNPTLINCTFAQNSAHNGNALACHFKFSPSILQIANCILWDGGNGIWNDDGSSINITFSNVDRTEGSAPWPGEGNINVDPAFADPTNGDYHLKSQAGRYDHNTQTWVQDDVTSPCIDAGDPDRPVAFEPFPNGRLVNMGAYGGTAEASRSPSGLHAKYGGGMGEAHDPYLIYTAEHLNTIGAAPSDWHKHFKLMADIDLSGFTGTDFNIIGSLRNYWGGRRSFTGVFDGNSHSISNFSYTSSDASYIGLFGHIALQATVKDLGLIDPNIDAGTGDNVGSLVGALQDGTIAGCYVEGGKVVGDESVGGLVGAYGDLKSLGGNSPPPYTITHCRSTSTVRGTRWVGGLVGSNYYGSITDCYATGSVSGKEIVGGLVGQNGYVDTFTNVPPTPGTVVNCYSTGPVSGESDVGGLLGSYIEGPVIGCFWDIETSGQASSADGTGLTTAEIQTGRTFLDAGWDFVDETENGTDDIWWILEGQDYPRLWWQHGLAFYPYPKDGAIDVIQLVILTWLAGGSDIDHDVYFGEDEEAITYATTESPGIYRGRQPGDVASFDPGKLALDTTYYWRIDEVDDAIIRKGNVWSFTTANFIVVDDFESYNQINPPDAATRRVFDIWIYGFGTTHNGALVPGLSGLERVLMACSPKTGPVIMRG